ncbi:hypothetical protein FACS18949_10380 [Clostridia bacterium]|nr:hypothetical protein FACS18949_10380 [Clostridia bacterium]
MIINDGKIENFHFNYSPMTDSLTEQTGTIKIVDVTPKIVVPGQETTFTVEVEYTSANVGGCIIYAGANTDESGRYRLYDEYVLPDIKGAYTFNFTCVPFKWTDNLFVFLTTKNGAKLTTVDVRFGR